MSPPSRTQGRGRQEVIPVVPRRDPRNPGMHQCGAQMSKVRER